MVEETDYAFYIGRVLDPDDEFAERQVLCRVSDSDELVWQPWDYAYGYMAVEFQRKGDALIFLRGIQFGISEGLEEAVRRLS
jgi:hypothetical protein